MSSTGFLLFWLIFLGFYLPLAYLFLIPAYLAYIWGKHDWWDKFIMTFVFLLSPPFFMPVGAVLVVSLGLMGVFLGVLVVLLFAIVSVLSFINVRFPFGGVFKAWFHAANWILQTVSELLKRLGLPPVQQTQQMRQLQ